MGSLTAAHEQHTNNGSRAKSANRSRGSRSTLPSKGAAITIQESEVGTLEYPLLRLLDSYKAVSFVRTQEVDCGVVDGYCGAADG